MEQRNINVEIVADSRNPSGKRIITALWTYPRFIHAEVMTHRQFSRNAASSRAIPIKKMIAAIKEHPAVPEYWGSNKAGMQAGAELDSDSIEHCQELWHDHRDEAIETVECLEENGLHKQISNRLLEPWMHITTLVTATEWDNFFALRAHPAAQPEFQVLAYRMLDQFIRHEPKELSWGDWHIPFDPGNEFSLEDRLTVSVAKAARTSYVAFDAKKDIEEQRNLFKSMRDNGHWSPFEHQAQAVPGAGGGNFHNGWLQYRHCFADECRTVTDHAALLANKPDWVKL